MKKFDELMNWEDKDKQEFSEEFKEVISAVKNWKNKLREKGYIVSFIASAHAYNRKTDKDKDCGVRIFGNKRVCRMLLEDLLTKVNEEESKWIDDQKK